MCKDEVGSGSGQGATRFRVAGPGNDILTHGNANGVYDHSDGKKILLDCGPGDDTAMLNITIDQRSLIMGT
jgi:hypothetical protein